jgi:cell division protein FtsQ
MKRLLILMASVLLCTAVVGQEVDRTEEFRQLYVTLSRAYAKKSLTELGNIIAADPFWQSQIVQVNVTRDGVELIPRVGDHIIWIGKPVDIEKKLDRLRKFYKYGLSHAGWNKYERISVEFDNQIVCKKRLRD